MQKISAPNSGIVYSHLEICNGRFSGTGQGIELLEPFDLPGSQIRIANVYISALEMLYKALLRIEELESK